MHWECDFSFDMFYIKLRRTHELGLRWIESIYIEVIAIKEI